MLVFGVIIGFDCANPVPLGLSLASALDPLEVAHHELVFSLCDTRTEAFRSLDHQSVKIEFWRGVIRDILYLIKLVKNLAHQGISDPWVLPRGASIIQSTV